MDIPASVLEAASADAERSYRIAFLDDDWDHWTGPEQIATYCGVREPCDGALACAQSRRGAHRLDLHRRRDRRAGAAVSGPMLSPEKAATKAIHDGAAA